MPRTKRNSVMEGLLIPYRRRKSLDTRTLQDEFFSDRSRIVFSSSFRRLMQKAQVFSLDPNSSVRNRLTHSLEVADVGRTIAAAVAHQLASKGLVASDLVVPITTIVENACLIHDIGNPPFGHFGEEAIKRWFGAVAPECVERLRLMEDHVRQEYLSDFLEFDGNPQGLRTVTRLLCDFDHYGLNLTLPTILSTLKYTRCSDERPNGPFSKKCGYFKTERDIVAELWSQLGMTQHLRYPLVYLMEAADDICYCLSDIADGFEKRIVDSRSFKENFREIWRSEPRRIEDPILGLDPIRYFGMQVSVPWSRRISKEVVQEYVAGIDRYVAGEGEEIMERCGSNDLLKSLKRYARVFLYTSPEAEHIELAGHRVVTGLLNDFSPLLVMDSGSFEEFSMNSTNPKGRGLDLEWRLFNLLSPKYRDSYKFQVKQGGDEWLLRAHLVVDYIAGMTDQFALETFQMLEGIRINV